MMTIKTLENTSLDVIISCFLEAFENYFVQMPTDPGYYKKRWADANIDFKNSFGMFHDDLLVGFIITVIDIRQGSKTAYNAGTGVIPAYRGRAIVKQLYQFAIPQLKRQGVTTALLEVITENVGAIKAYESAGFNSIKTYKCFKGEINVAANASVVLKEYAFEKIPWERLPNLDSYSWDNQRGRIPNLGNTYYEVFSEEKLIGYFIINNTLDYVFQLDVFDTSQKSWGLLFQGIRQVNNTIRINNIDASLTDKTAAIEHAGLHNHVDQFEMILRF